jgi:hypothetical protein
MATPSSTRPDVLATDFETWYRSKKHSPRAKSFSPRPQAPSPSLQEREHHQQDEGKTEVTALDDDLAWRADQERDHQQNQLILQILHSARLKLKEFTLFPLLPFELRLKIVNVVAFLIPDFV